MNAAAVHTTPSVTTEATTSADGRGPGTPSVRSTTGTYASAVSVRAEAMLPLPATPGTVRLRMAGPAAYPRTTTPTSATAPRSEPPTSSPTSAVTPTIPTARPSQATGLSRAARPVANAIATPASGTAAISRPVVELGSRVSALPRRTHGM